MCSLCFCLPCPLQSSEEHWTGLRLGVFLRWLPQDAARKLALEQNNLGFGTLRKHYINENLYSFNNNTLFIQQIFIKGPGCAKYSSWHRGYSNEPENPPSHLQQQQKIKSSLWSIYWVQLCVPYRFRRAQNHSIVIKHPSVFSAPGTVLFMRILSSYIKEPIVQWMILTSTKGILVPSGKFSKSTTSRELDVTKMEALWGSSR